MKQAGSNNAPSKLPGQRVTDMELSNKSARQLFEELKANPTRRRFGFGEKAAIVNVDLQKAYTLENEFKSAYSTTMLLLRSRVEFSMHFGWLLG